MTVLHTALIQIKQYFVELAFVLGLSFFTNFWNELEKQFEKELNTALIGHGITKRNSVTLQNIHGSYASSVTYEWDGNGIIGHWIVKPKGFRRAFAVIFRKAATKRIIKDFQNYVNEQKQ